MHCEKKLQEDLYWVGSSDRRLALFENVFPVPRGVSYNAYVILDEKTILLDTVDRSISDVFFENLEFVLNGRLLDYLVINHMEPDHCATVQDVVRRYPQIKIICNVKMVPMAKQLFDFDLESYAIVVKEFDTICTGKHSFTFVMAPMVHWPEVMVTYDKTNKTLFSADAFGTFGAINGSIFADELKFESHWLPDARRYFANIIGKYGSQVQTLLKKVAALDIEMICPLHGPVWRKNIDWIVDKYQHWSLYQPEEQAVMIAYASVYGNTENAVNILASRLADLGILNVVMYDVSLTHPSEIVSESFRCSHLVFASTTYNAGIFCNMETILTDLKAHNLQNRTIALLQNGTWAPTAGSLMRKQFETMENMNILDVQVDIFSSVKEKQLEEIEVMAYVIAETLVKAEPTNSHGSKIDPNVMFKIPCALFMLSARDETKDNGCIINTVMQLTDMPKRVTITINKQSHTHDMIVKTGEFNVSILSEDASFKLFERFGFQSGFDTEKFEGYEHWDRSENGIAYLIRYSCAYLSCTVVEMTDYGTHTLFVAVNTESKILNSNSPMTYAYYFANVKPKPQLIEGNKKGYICKICAYIYEGEVLPDDYICPLCKHGATDFEKIN